MHLTPLEIQQQTFKIGFRGFDKKEVADFLETVAEEFTILNKNYLELKSELQRSKRDLEAFKQREEDLKGAMLMAQKAGEELREHSEKEADLLMDQAQLRAEKILLAAQDDLSHLKSELSDLRRQKVLLLEEIRSVLHTHSRLLEVHEQKLTVKRKDHLTMEPLAGSAQESIAYTEDKSIFERLRAQQQNMQPLQPS